MTSATPTFILWSMKATVTLDDDVAAALERLSRERDASLDDVVNEVLKRGLPGMTRGRATAPRYETRPVSLGRVLMPIDNVAETIAAAEGEKAT